MVGIYTGPLPGNDDLAAQGAVEQPYTLGYAASLGQGLAMDPTLRLLREDARNIGSTGYVPEGDVPTPYQIPSTPLPEPMLDPETANATYGIKGNLTFDQPIPASVAQDLYEHHRDDLFRKDRIAKAGVGGFAQFTAGIATSLLDPMNVAAAFIPVADKRR